MAQKALLILIHFIIYSIVEAGINELSGDLFPGSDGAQTPSPTNLEDAPVLGQNQLDLKIACLDQNMRPIFDLNGANLDHCVYSPDIVTNNKQISLSCLKRELEFRNSNCQRDHLCYAACRNSNCLQGGLAFHLLSLKKENLIRFGTFTSLFGGFVLCFIFLMDFINKSEISRLTHQIILTSSIENEEALATDSDVKSLSEDCQRGRESMNNAEENDGPASILGPVRKVKSFSDS